ncbi:MAG TPA: hypothetical protein VIF15_21125, partial [Polyangiaceae bacterium]
IATSAVKRLDLLFMIDNSKSMGDKQDYLARAIPDLLTRLVTPNCVDLVDATKVLGASRDGSCDAGRIEFPPVHDMHIAVVSSSLGNMGGDVCPLPSTPAPNGEDDDAQILNRAGVADAPGAFLGWFPSTSANAGAPPPAQPVGDPGVLVGDFQRIVTGIGEGGCGIEAQLESWYRFLVQPDPYASIAVHNGGAVLQGVDATVLRQRHDFLRSDSLLAIIDLSDENDSSVDVRAYAGTEIAGYHMMERDTGPFRGTSACAANPQDPACTSCAARSASGDPACVTPQYDPVSDAAGTPNIRHVHMKQAFGIDFQYPIERYLSGLTDPVVPDRDGEYPQGAQTYRGTANCSNPIFSQDLPDGTNLDPAVLCKLTRGPRTKDLVYYAHIGGVPADLLHFDPASPQASQLTGADWTKILGKDPQASDYGGIDPRMNETYKQRPYFQSPFAPYWDLAFACTFPLPQPRDCTQAANSGGCDCATSPPSSVSGWELCSATDATRQIAAKAYPTVRELLLAKLLGDRGVVSSLCPIHVTEQQPGDPLFGYRPAMSAIIERLKTSLVGECVPRPLQPDPTGAVRCLVLASLPQAGLPCDASKGESDVDPLTLQRSRDSLAGQDTAALLDPSQHTVCQLAQLSGADLVGASCVQSPKPGWCYVTGGAAGSCPQALTFSPGGQPTAGTQTLLTCLEAAQ